MSEYGNGIKATTTEDLRLRNYRTELNRRNEAEIREMDARHGENVAKLQESELAQLEQLKHAYEIQFSQEAEALEEKLRDLRAENDKRVDGEKKQGENELVKTRSMYQAK